jgi:DNA-nicking Smr family endonuclease
MCRYHATPKVAREAQKQTTFDRRIERSLRLGKIEIEARIDLHGMTQEKAYAALENFMATQAKRGHRHLLIITGKGKNKEGTLRSNLPHWLQSLPETPQILTLRPAAPKHGGEGAFYVMLKKKHK